MHPSTQSCCGRRFKSFESSLLAVSTNEEGGLLAGNLTQPKPADKSAFCLSNDQGKIAMKMKFVICLAMCLICAGLAYADTDSNASAPEDYPPDATTALDVDLDEALQQEQVPTGPPQAASYVDASVAGSQAMQATSIGNSSSVDTVEHTAAFGPGPLIPYCTGGWCGNGGHPPNHTDLGDCLCPDPAVPCRQYRNNATGAKCYDNCR